MKAALRVSLPDRHEVVAGLDGLTPDELVTECGRRRDEIQATIDRIAPFLGLAAQLEEELDRYLAEHSKQLGQPRPEVEAITWPPCHVHAIELAIGAELQSQCRSRSAR